MNICAYTDLKLDVGDYDSREYPLHILIDGMLPNNNNMYVPSDIDCFFFLDNSVLYEHDHRGSNYLPPSRMIYV